MIHLPIKIEDDRRMHVLQLTPTESCVSEHITYLVNRGNSVPLLFSIDKVAKLFSATGVLNFEYRTFHLRVNQEQNQNRDQTIFDVWWCNKKISEKHGLVELPKKADEQNSLQVAKNDTKTLRFNTNNNHNKHIKIIFHIEVDNLIYTDTLSFYIYDPAECEYRSAAVDFGSDSSQVRHTDAEGGERNRNMKLIDVFKKIANQSEAENNNIYVQSVIDGKEINEGLYKSVFYIRKSNSNPVYFGSKPMGNNKEQFVQMLLPKNCNYWNDLLLLPNLKLVEIDPETLLDEVVGSDDEITFENNPNSEDALNDGSISESSFRKNVLRVILGYFLHAILHSIQGAKCLNLVMLVPNVYSQDRVQRLINNLYKDFAIYKATEEGKKVSCEAIEVQAISESDASFLGLADKSHAESMRAGETVLVIDAGKGTTDFSILKKNNGTNFTSVYRDGIPASGNVITYAFYEAFRDFVYSANGGKVNLDNILFDARSEYALRVKALDYFEECKKRFRSNLQGVKMVNEYVAMSGNSNQRTQLSSIFDALVEDDNKDDNKKEWKGCYNIPGAEKRVEEKLNALSVMLFNSIDTYMSGVTTTAFTKVFLMGRAFKFAPFRKMVVDQLLARGWILNNDKKLIEFQKEGDNSKIKCVAGALKINGGVSINNNSGIIGAPIFYRRVDSFVEKLPFLAKLVEKVEHGKVVSRDNMNFYKKVVALNDDFYYKGFDYKPEEFFVVGDFKYSFNIGNAKSAKVYFNGKNFVCPQSATPYGLVTRMPSTITEEQVGKGNTPFDLLKQSLFPLNVVQGATTTIIEQTDTTVMEQKSDPHKNKTDNSSSNNADGDNNVLDN